MTEISILRDSAYISLYLRDAVRFSAKMTNLNKHLNLNNSPYR